jgi:amidase
MAAAPAIYAQTFQAVDVVLSPTTALPPPVGTLAPTRDYDALLADLIRFIPYTPLQNLAGAPAISLPLAATPDGLPLGIMLAADRGGDDALLALAFELEAARPWATRWPACVPA